MFSMCNLEAASRRAALLMTAATLGLAGLSFSASAQNLTGQDAAQPATVTEAAPAPAPQVAPAPVSVRQAVTEVNPQQATDAAPIADAAPADASTTDAVPATNAAPVTKQGQRRVIVSQPAQPSFKAPAYGHRQAYAPVPHFVHRHVVHPQHFGYRHVRHGYVVRSNSYGNYGYHAHGYGFRLNGGYVRH